jgi:hypothetical protein
MSDESENLVDADMGGMKENGVEAAGAAFLAVDAPIEPILERLEDFFSSPDLTSAIADFMGEHSAALQFVGPDDEQPMHNYEAGPGPRQVLVPLPPVRQPLYRVGRHPGPWTPSTYSSTCGIFGPPSAAIDTSTQPQLPQL